MANADWLERLGTLLNRFPHLGIGEDLAAMSEAELRGVHRYLSRLAGG